MTARNPRTPQHPVLVCAIDRTDSGWGATVGGVARLVIRCRNTAQAEHAVKWLAAQPERFKFVSVRDKPPRASPHDTQTVKRFECHPCSEDFTE